MYFDHSFPFLQLLPDPPNLPTHPRFMLLSLSLFNPPPLSLYYQGTASCSNSNFNHRVELPLFLCIFAGL